MFLEGTKPVSEPITMYHQIIHVQLTSLEILLKVIIMVHLKMKRLKSRPQPQVTMS